ncbi:MAG: hypothetical protein CBD39_03390 [Flavobacteriaceae bacterium TMED179]|nr:MAG: hypothetical protein CBD39_03390 [Flavobacteriaceae bacterium TMED179]|tara:strand:- start:5527 stop:6048 length:522 start_codon:yes stop_codon:yes gene_type:complete
MKNYFFLLSLFLVIACGEGNKLKDSSSDSIKNNIGEELISDENFELVDYPEDFLKENGLEEWEDFRNLHKAMDRLKEMDIRDIELNIIGLSSRLKDLISQDLPGGFETPQIRSRLKVVQMQTQKSRYFTRHYKKDSLLPSLRALYYHYNVLILRMIVLKEDENVAVSETKQMP